MKKLLFIVDTPNWAHDFKAQAIKKHTEATYPGQYEITIAYQIPQLHDQRETAHHTALLLSQITEADLILVFYFDQISFMPWRLRSAIQAARGKVCIGICSHSEMDRIQLMGEYRALFACSKLLYNMATIHKNEVFYTPNGVDTDFFRPNPEPRLNRPPLVVGWAGSRDSKEGDIKGYYSHILPAVQMPGVVFLPAAREDKWRSRKEMLDFYLKIDVYLCASESEGTPNPCLEAAACGVPIVTTRVGNMPEFLKDSENGFFVDRDITDIQRKLFVLRELPKNRISMGEKARQRALEWDWSIQARNYKPLFDL